MRSFFCTALFAATLVLGFNTAITPAPVRAQTAGYRVTETAAPDLAPAVATGADKVVTQTAKPVDVAATATDAPTDISPAPSLADLVAARRADSTPDTEAQCLATAVYFEAKGEPLTGQLAVAQVLINRTKSGRFPPTLCGVLMQSHQFSFVHGGRLPHIAAGNAAWRTAIAIASIARDEAWKPVIGQAMFFHARRVSPHWHATQVAALGNHIFYR